MKMILFDIQTVLRKRVIACLDVRMNDSGDIVVTKGDQYDVRHKDGEVCLFHTNFAEYFNFNARNQFVE